MTHYFVNKFTNGKVLTLSLDIVNNSPRLNCFPKITPEDMKSAEFVKEYEQWREDVAVEITTILIDKIKK